MNTPETTSTPQDRPAELEACATPSAGGEYVDHPIALPVPSSEDKDELEQHEAIIANSLTNAFVQAGTSLGVIQNKKLYKGQFDNFDAYVQHRWGWQRAHAYRLIQAAQIVGQLSPIGDTLPMPTSESQLRPLSRLDAEKQRMVWMKAVQDAGGRTPTADLVKAAVVGVVGPRKPTAPTTDPANGKTAETPDGRAPAEHQPPEPVTATNVPPVVPSLLQRELPMEAVPTRLAEPASNALAEAVDDLGDRHLDTAPNAEIRNEGSPKPGETNPEPDGAPATRSTAPASQASGPVQPETVFQLADGTEIPATEWMDGWIAAKWMTGMLRDLERQSSLAVPVSAERCSRRQRLRVALAATLNRSGSDPDAEYLRDMEDALGDLRNIVRTHSNYPYPVRTSMKSLD